LENSVIVFRQVTKKYYSMPALQDVSIEIPPGEVVGLLGPNGAGKTTFIKLIAGLISPTAGEVSAGNGAWPSIGYKPERLVFPGNMRVSQYLELVAGLCGRQPVDNMVLESLARVNLLGAAGKQIRTLSKGMRQRLGLAQALIGNPAVLLLDEPTSGLDPAGQDEVLSYIEELRTAGRTIIMASHQLAEVTRVCSHIVILKDGKVLYQNDVTEALTLQPYVVIQADRDLDGVRHLLTMVHPDVAVENSAVTLRNDAIHLRRQVLSVLISQGYDVVKVEQKRITLAEIYAEAVQ
jgi:ABC-2 type transport system ATP-binding protein